MKVVYCEPMKEAKICEIGNELADMQKAVGGYIEAYYPFDDDVAIVCNEEGKLIGLEPCRGVFVDGEIVDIVFGAFFICGLGEENFESLSDEQIERYGTMFKYPEKFYRVNGKIESVKIKEVK